MEEGSRELHKGGAEWFGGALEVKAAEKAHARLKRMVGRCRLTL
jgi:hypothetical protein